MVTTTKKIQAEEKEEKEIDTDVNRGCLYCENVKVLGLLSHIVSTFCYFSNLLVISTLHIFL